MFQALEAINLKMLSFFCGVDCLQVFFINPSGICCMTICVPSSDAFEGIEIGLLPSKDYCVSYSQPLNRCCTQCRCSVVLWFFFWKRNFGFCRTLCHCMSFSCPCSHDFQNFRQEHVLHLKECFLLDEQLYCQENTRDYSNLLGVRWHNWWIWGLV